MKRLSAWFRRKENPAGEHARQKPLETVQESSSGLGTFPRALPSAQGEGLSPFRYGEYVSYPYADARVLFPFLRYLRDSIPDVSAAAVPEWVES